MSEIARLIITLTDKQNSAKNKCLNWYKTRYKPTFTIAGVAGSGKSTIIRVIIEELGLGRENVAYCAYTGMASNVLIRKGNPATTIHKLIYDPVEIEDEKTKKKKIVFKLKEQLDENIRLIVVDEVSMVSQKMLDELISFNIPILATGDPKQLPPIANDMNKLLASPDVFLDEPLRQALDNPIIYIANQLRQGIVPQYGSYGGRVNIYKSDRFPVEALTEADQILAGKNRTVENLNKFYRANVLGKNTLLPTEGEKIICLKNNWDLRIQEKGIENYLVNGLIGTVSNMKIQPKAKLFTCDLKPIYFEKEQFKKIYGDSLIFSDPNCKDKYYVEENYPYESLMRRPLEVGQVKINQFTYAYCITVYKSQGSEADKVLYYDEVLNKRLYFEHFYTAVTRAKEYLDIVI